MHILAYYMMHECYRNVCMEVPFKKGLTVVICTSSRSIPRVFQLLQRCREILKQQK